MPQRTTYRCADCGRTFDADNLKGIRTRYPCRDCREVTTFERVDA